MIIKTENQIKLKWCYRPKCNMSGMTENKKGGVRGGRVRVRHGKGGVRVWVGVRVRFGWGLGEGLGGG